MFDIIHSKDYDPGYILRIFVFYQIFLSPQVKQSVIISNKCGTYRPSNELLNDLRLGSLEITKLRNIRKILKPHRIMAQRPASPPPKKKIANTSKKPMKNIR